LKNIEDLVLVSWLQ